MDNLDKNKLIECINKNVFVTHGDLLDSKEEYIVQQVNASGNKNMGLASLISKKYPTSNLYSGKYSVSSRVPGTIIIRDKVINIVGQINPGKPFGNDSQINRVNFFKNALKSFPKNIKSVAFPMGIGCGLARGDWNIYLQLIKEYKRENPNTTVVIYKLN